MSGGADRAQRALDQRARTAAATLVAALRIQAPTALMIRGADLGTALEQQLFFRLRADDPPMAGNRLLAEAESLVRIAGTAAAGLGSIARRAPAPGSVVALVRQGVHLESLALIEPELRGIGGPALHAIRIGPAARQNREAGTPRAPTLFEVVDPRLIPPLAAHHIAVRGISGSAAVSASVAAFARRELDRIAAGAIGVESVVRRYRPSLLVSFDEIGTWARILPAVARRWGVPTLDLPHAEAADPVAIEGAGYDTFAVYGPQAREVLDRAGIPAHRVHEIGAPRFDPLIATARELPAPTTRDSVLFAGQYVTGRLTADALAATYRAALAAAAATGSPLIVVPHPAQPEGTVERLMHTNPAPAGVRATVATTGLHAALAESWLVITGWSNSVMEAAIAGVPSIAVTPGGVDAPVAFAADGLAVAATDERSAAAAATELRMPANAQEAVARARASLTRRLGPLDGGASARAAALIRSLATAPR